MTVVEAMNELRQRYFVCKGARCVVEIAPAIGLTRKTLARFGHGGFLRERAVLAIEKWVGEEEAKQAEARRERARYGTPAV